MFAVFISPFWAGGSAFAQAMRMAIYADNGGNPGTVLGDTAQFDAGPGLRSAALKTPVEITEGNVYWIATWVRSGGSETTNVTFVANDGAGTRYRWTRLQCHGELLQRFRAGLLGQHDVRSLRDRH